MTNPPAGGQNGLNFRFLRHRRIRLWRRIYLGFVIYLELVILNL
ncbi:MAG: hypothetical protein AAB731_04895 [Patescibacteria group bacterium]